MARKSKETETEVATVTTRKPKRAWRIAREFAGTIATFNFVTGKGDDVTVLDSLTVDTSDYSDDVNESLRMHGVSQKIGDSATKCDGTVEDAMGIMGGVADQLSVGTWSMKREGGGGAVGGLLFRAIVNVIVANGRENTAALRESVRDKLSNEDGKPNPRARKSALANPEFKAEYDVLKAAQDAQRDAVDEGTVALETTDF